MEIILPNPTEHYVGQKKKRDRDHTYLKNILTERNTYTVFSASSSLINVITKHLLLSH